MRALALALLLTGCTEPLHFELDATIIPFGTDAVDGDAERTFVYRDLAAAKADPPTIEVVDGAGSHVLLVPYECEEYDAIRATTRIWIMRDDMGAPRFMGDRTTCTSSNGVTIISQP